MKENCPYCQSEVDGFFPSADFVDPACHRYANSIIYSLALATFMIAGALIVNLVGIAMGNPYGREVGLAVLHTFAGLVAADRLYRTRRLATVLCTTLVIASAFKMLMAFSYGISLFRLNAYALLADPLIFAVSAVFCAYAMRKGDKNISHTSFFHIMSGMEKDGVRVDYATCGNCNKNTAISVERKLPFPYKRRYFYRCEHCGIYIRGNPVRNLLFGVMEVVAVGSFFLFNIPSPAAGKPAVMVIVGIITVTAAFDGIRRALDSIQALFAALKIQRSRDSIAV